MRKKRALETYNLCTHHITFCAKKGTGSERVSKVCSTHKVRVKIFKTISGHFHSKQRRGRRAIKQITASHRINLTTADNDNTPKASILAFSTAHDTSSALEIEIEFPHNAINM